MDTYLVGRWAYTNKNLNQTKEWMEETLSLMGTHESLEDLVSVVTRVTVLEHLAFVYFQVETKLMKENLTNASFDINNSISINDVIGWIEQHHL